MSSPDTTPQSPEAGPAERVVLELPRAVVDLARDVRELHERGKTFTVSALLVAAAIVDAADSAQPTNACADHSCDVVHPGITHDLYLDDCATGADELGAAHRALLGAEWRSAVQWPGAGNGRVDL